MGKVKQPQEMTLRESVEALAKHQTEHDLDCEEGGPSDRCAPCLAAAAVEKVTALYESACGVEEFLRKVMQWKGSDEDELSQAIEEAEELTAALDSPPEGDHA